MTAHCIRIKTSKNQESKRGSVRKPDPPELPDVVHDRVKQHIKNNFNPVLEGQDSPPGLAKAGDMTSFDVDHARCCYRFDGSDDKESLLDSIEKRLRPDAKWYKIESHECTHDGLTRTVEKTRELPDGTTETYTEEVSGCSSWKTERTKGNIPEGV